MLLLPAAAEIYSIFSSYDCNTVAFQTPMLKHDCGYRRPQGLLASAVTKVTMARAKAKKKKATRKLSSADEEIPSPPASMIKSMCTHSAYLLLMHLKTPGPGLKLILY